MLNRLVDWWHTSPLTSLSTPAANKHQSGSAEESDSTPPFCRRRRPLPATQRAPQAPPLSSRSCCCCCCRRTAQSTRNSGIRTHSHIPPPTVERTGKEQSRAGCSVLSHADGTPKRGGHGRTARRRLPVWHLEKKKCRLRFKLQVRRREELPVNPAAGGWRYDGAVDMDKVLNWLFAAITLLLSVRGEVFKGKDDHLEMFECSERIALFAGGRRGAETQFGHCFWPHSSTAGQLCARSKHKLACYFKQELRPHVGFVPPLRVVARFTCRLRTAAITGTSVSSPARVWFTRPQVKAVHCLCLTLSW